MSNNIIKREFGKEITISVFIAIGVEGMKRVRSGIKRGKTFFNKIAVNCGSVSLAPRMPISNRIVNFVKP